MLMHMGALPVIASLSPKNLIHVVINNCAHETVGGMPTAVGSMDVAAAARACGYPRAVTVSDPASLDAALESAKEAGQLSLIEVKCSIGARSDLGRPTTTAKENKEQFMKYLQKDCRNQEYKGC